MKDRFSIVSKILSQENIKFEYDKVPTASFNFKERKITLPVAQWNSREIYEHFVIHEVAHALFSKYTHDEISKYNQKYPEIFNLIEDIYINNQIVKKFAGVKSIFNVGIAALLKDGFYGCIDNLKEYSKTGSLIERIMLKHIIKLYNVTEHPEEAHIFDKLNKLFSNNCVLECCQLIADFLAKNNHENKIHATGDSQQNSEEASEYSETLDSEESSEDNSTKETQNRISENLETNIKARYNDVLFSMENSKNITVPILDTVKHIQDVRPFITALSNCLDEIEYFKLASSAGGIEIVDNINETLEAVRISNMMFQNLHTARKIKNVQHKKTGSLNNKHLYKYLTSENVFKLKAIKNNEQNHGLVILIDFSGSMCNKIKQVFMQTAITAEFCYQNNIEFKIVSYGSFFRCYDYIIGDKNIDYIHTDDLFQFLRYDSRQNSIKTNQCLIADNSSWSLQGFFGLQQFMGYPDTKYRNKLSMYTYLNKKLLDKQIDCNSFKSPIIRNMFKIAVKCFENNNLDIFYKLYPLHAIELGECTPTPDAIASAADYFIPQLKASGVDKTNIIIITDGISTAITGNLMMKDIIETETGISSKLKKIYHYMNVYNKIYHPIINGNSISIEIMADFFKKYRNINLSAEQAFEYAICYYIKKMYGSNIIYSYITSSPHELRNYVKNIKEFIGKNANIKDNEYVSTIITNRNAPIEVKSFTFKNIPFLDGIIIQTAKKITNVKGFGNNSFSAKTNKTLEKIIQKNSNTEKYMIYAKELINLIA